MRACSASSRSRSCLALLLLLRCRVPTARQVQVVLTVKVMGGLGEQEALEAAAKEAEYAKNKALHLLQQEEERKRADAVAEVAEAAERDKALALAGLLPPLSSLLSPPLSSSLLLSPPLSSSLLLSPLPSSVLLLPPVSSSVLSRPLCLCPPPTASAVVCGSGSMHSASRREEPDYSTHGHASGASYPQSPRVCARVYHPCRCVRACMCAHGRMHVWTDFRVKHHAGGHTCVHAAMRVDEVVVLTARVRMWG